MNEELKKCGNELCSRQIRVSVLFCCYACNLASEKHFEIHESGPLGHSEGCNSRHEVRGEWKGDESVLGRVLHVGDAGSADDHGGDQTSLPPSATAAPDAQGAEGKQEGDGGLGGWSPRGHFGNVFS